MEVAEASASASSSEDNENPISGGITRTRSVRNHLLESEVHTQREKSFLPRIQQPRNNELVKMPSMSSSSKTPPTSNVPGVESPQYGWFIRTTPPTPEMYYSKSYHRKQESEASTSQASTASILSDASSSYGTHSIPTPPVKPNLIFQGLQDRNKDRTNFPAVPL